MKKLLTILLILTACGGAGGGDEQSSSSIITNCGNRISRADVSVTCNIGDDEAGTDAACNKCGENYIECISNPSENGLTDDSLCNDIKDTCLEINGCEVAIES